MQAQGLLNNIPTAYLRLSVYCSVLRQIRRTEIVQKCLSGVLTIREYGESRSFSRVRSVHKASILHRGKRLSSGFACLTRKPDLFRATAICAILLHIVRHLPVVSARQYLSSSVMPPLLCNHYSSGNSSDRMCGYKKITEIGPLRTFLSDFLRPYYT